MDRMIHGFILLAVFSLVLAGCTTTEEVQNVSDETGTAAGQETADAGTATGQEDDSGTSMPEEQETPPAETAEPSDEAVWGDECEQNYDCPGFDDLCVLGFCETPECVFTSSCDEGQHCFNGKCYDIPDLYAEFPECSINMFYCGDQPCDTCAKAQRSCIMTGSSSGNVSVDYRICVDCTRDADCIEGYRCVQHYCVAGPDS